jgi:ATP-binding cassette subfamily E protein 1
MPPKKNQTKNEGNKEEHLTRIAIVNASKCKPKKCNQECKKSCPVVKLGKLCIEVGPKSKVAFISEPLCIGKFWNHFLQAQECIEISPLFCDVS